MLLKSYRLEIFRPRCNPGFESLHCFAHLDQDIGAALPYLNAVLGGFEYLKDPPALTLRTQGKIITLHPRKIAINALRDAEEAQKILTWLKREINEIWEKRETLEARVEVAPRPKVLEILKLLPRTNCRKCGQPTCMAFAAQMAQGLKASEDCPELSVESARPLGSYMEKFHFESWVG